MDTKKILNAILRFRKLIATFVILVGFFSYYNIFLIDSTLENLRFTLEQTAMAYDIEDTNGLDMVLSQATAKEISPAKINAFDMGNLEYATNIVNTGSNYNQLDYLKVAISTVIKDKEKERGFLLAMLDRINRPIRKGMIYLAYLPRYLFRPRVAEAQTFGDAADTQLLDKLRAIEKEGDLNKAIIQYRELALAYAESDKIALIKLRLAYTYHRLGEYDEAMKLYKEIAGAYYPGQPAKIARILLNALKKKDELLNQANILIIQSAEVADDDPALKQDIYYRTGLVYTKLFNLNEARMFFKRAIELDPVSDIAIKSQFNMAWMLKQEYKLTESAEALRNIVEKKPESGMVLDTRYQLADILHSEGKYQDAIDVQLEIAEKYENEEIAPLLLFQAGASYMYDLNDTKKAKEIFAKLTQKYPDSAYAQYLAPKKGFIGMFLTYVVPRATRVIAWRLAGLFTLSGYSGELAEATLVSEEAGLNVAVNDWILEEFPDTLGDIYFDMKGLEIELEKNISVSGNLTFGKWAARGEGELHFEKTRDGGVRIVVTKAFLNKIPLPPILINAALTKLTLLFNKYFPIVITDISTDNGKLNIAGYGSKKILERIENSTKKRLGAKVEIKDIEDPKEKKDVYALFKEKFPASNFSPSPEYTTEELFLDFFIRMYLYAGFKLLETIKDSKMDYQRSIRTLGRLMLVESKFRVKYTENHVNASANRFVENEFPWIVNNKFFFDVIGLNFHFKDNGEIEFSAHLGLGDGDMLSANPSRVYTEGTMVLDIDKKSKLPVAVFKSVSLNNKAFPAEKLNRVTATALDLLKDAHTPLKLEEINVYEGGISLKGKAPRDYTERIFSDPYLFVIFHIREWDLGLAGIERLKRPVSPTEYGLSKKYEEYRGMAWDKGGYDFPRVHKNE